MPQALSPKTFSPKEVAAAIGVSESSLKRWADEGLLEVTRTVGGHRRITLPEAIRFARSKDLPLVRPDMLGLPALSPDEPARKLAPDEALRDLLTSGRTEEARSLLIDRYLAGQSVVDIIDGPVRTAMTQIGSLWRHDGAQGIYREHRATDSLIQALSSLRQLLPPPAENSTVVLGGSVTGDTHLLPSLAIASALRELGFDDHNLGADVPLDALLVAADEHRPRLFWLSCSTPHARPEDDSLQPLFDYLDENKAALVVGGAGFVDEPPPKHPRVTVCQSLAELKAFVQGMAMA